MLGNVNNVQLNPKAKQVKFGDAFDDLANSPQKYNAETATKPLENQPKDDIYARSLNQPMEEKKKMGIGKMIAIGVGVVGAGVVSYRLIKGKGNFLERLFGKRDSKSIKIGEKISDNEFVLKLTHSKGNFEGIKATVNDGIVTLKLKDGVEDKDGKAIRRAARLLARDESKPLGEIKGIKIPKDNATKYIEAGLEHKDDMVLFDNDNLAKLKEGKKDGNTQWVKKEPTNNGGTPGGTPTIPEPNTGGTIAPNPKSIKTEKIGDTNNHSIKLTHPKGDFEGIEATVQDGVATLKLKDGVEDKDNKAIRRAARLLARDNSKSLGEEIKGIKIPKDNATKYIEAGLEEKDGMVLFDNFNLAKLAEGKKDGETRWVKKEPTNNGGTLVNSDPNTGGTPNPNNKKPKDPDGDKTIVSEHTELKKTETPKTKLEA